MGESEVNGLIFDGGPVSWTQPTSRRELVRHVRSLCSAPSFHVCRAADVPAIVGQYSGVNATFGAPACATDMNAGKNAGTSDGIPTANCRTAVAALMGDALDQCTQRRTARWMSAIGMRTFVYSWRWRPRCPMLDSLIPTDWGAYHESEIPYLFPPFKGHSPDNALT